MDLFSVRAFSFLHNVMASYSSFDGSSSWVPIVNRSSRARRHDKWPIDILSWKVSNHRRYQGNDILRVSESPLHWYSLQSLYEHFGTQVDQLRTPNWADLWLASSLMSWDHKNGAKLTQHGILNRSCTSADHARHLQRWKVFSTESKMT